MIGLGVGCCCEETCVGCDCSDASSVQVDSTFGDDECGDCSIFDSVILPKVTAFTTLPGGLGEGCIATDYNGPCFLPPGVTSAPVCYYQDETEVACDTGNPTKIRWRVSIHRPSDDLGKLVVMASVVLVRGAFFGSGADLQARNGSVLWAGECDEIDVDVPLDTLCIDNGAPYACVLPDTVRVTVL